MGFITARSRRYMSLCVAVPILCLALWAYVTEAHGKNLWLDEATEFIVAHRPLQSVVAVDRATTHDPPLYSLVLHFWMRGGLDDFYLRMLSVYLGLLAVATVLALGRRVFSPAVGWLGALLVAVTPRAVFYAQEVNQYALVMLLAALCPLLLERFFRRPTLGRLAVFLGAGVMALLTHYELALYLMALAGVGTGYLIWRAWRRERRPLWMWVAALSLLASIGLGLLWFYALPQKARLPGDFAPVRYHGPISILNEVGLWAFQSAAVFRFLFWGWGNRLSPNQVLTDVLLIAGAIAGLLRPMSRRPVLYLVGGLAISFVASGFGFLVYAHRYVWYAFPLSALLVAGGLLMPAWSKWPLGRKVVTGSAIILSLSLLVANWPAVSGVPFEETEQFGEVVHFVEARRQPGDAIYVYYGATPAFAVYATREMADSAVVQKMKPNESASEQQSDMWSVLGGQARAWLLFSHVRRDEDKPLLSLLDARCRQLDKITAVGAKGYLFNCALSR